MSKIKIVIALAVAALVVAVVVQYQTINELRQEIEGLKQQLSPKSLTQDGEPAKAQQQIQTPQQPTGSAPETKKDETTAPAAETPKDPNTIACVKNLELIEAAKKQWALENHKLPEHIVTMGELQPFLGGVDPATLVCPAGGVYTIGTVAEKPTCSIPGHVLP